MAYDAITIDSNVVIHSGINLETGLLAQLFQFKEGPVDFVISDVVVYEIRKHLNKNTKKARDTAIAAVRTAIELKLVEEAEAATMQTSVEAMSDSRDAATARIQTFLAKTGAKAVSSSAISADSLMRLYFQAKPPFDEVGPKKEEFPDAVALLALEKWASDNGKKILAVSGDKGWAAFAEENEHIDVVQELGPALATLQQHTEEAVIAVSTLLKAISSGQSLDNNTGLLGYLENSVEELDVRAEAESHMHYELDSVQLELSSYELLEHDGGFDIKIVRMGANEMVAQVGASLAISAEAEFSLSVKDGIDKDYVSMGGALSNRQINLETDLLLTFGGDVLASPLSGEVLEAEILDRSLTIDFGSLELEHDEDDYQDWLDEDQDADVSSEVVHLNSPF